MIVGDLPPRPDPDELLRHLQAEHSARGRLKVFLGYAAGVGKTFAMLEAAHQRKADGIDIVAGYVETHGRVETEAMLEGLEVMPRKAVEYHNVRLPELDVDAVLSRRPELVLVDELAHTNAPGSRHPKRYFDVDEILDAGIDVYTTLNIQHLESLNDVVAQVTGIVVRETVPDRVLDEASEIEVVDLPPDELLARLKEGKVYIPDQAARAIQKFFRKGNLTALREMSLRRAAERVDDQMRAYMQTRAIPGPWAATERLLVCISPSPLAERLVRTARRLADELNAEWYAAYVEIASRPELDAANRQRIGKTLQLAEELGGKSLTLAGRSIHEAALNYARKNNVTKIIVGRPLRPRWQEILSGSVVEQLVRNSGDIDVYVIGAPPGTQLLAIPAEWQPHRPLGRYLVSLGMVASATALGWLVRSGLEPANLVMLYLAVVVISAIYLGRGPSLLASIVGVLAFDFFLIPPFLTFAVSDTQYILTFVGLFVVSLVVSNLTARAREQAEASLQREMQTSTLYNLGRDLTAAEDLKDIAGVIITRTSQFFDGDAAIFLPVADYVKPFASTPGYNPNDNELAVASWAYAHDQSAGLGTDTLSAVPLRCLPLKTAHGLVGILGIRPPEPGYLLTPEKRQALASFANLSALALERAILAEQAHQAMLLQATEKLQTALLNSISHDLRSPLTSIMGILSSLANQAANLDENQQQSLLQMATTETARLNRLVGNLLDMTRLESGAIHIRRQPCDLQDVIGAAREQASDRLGDHPVHIDLPSDLPSISMDAVLMVQTLANLLDNAIKYSPAGSPIEVSARLSGEMLQIAVADRGVGIPSEDLQRVFDKFYRVQRPESVSGTGLGLAICKGIIEAHGGTIWANRRPGGGTVVSITLPAEELQ